MDKEEKFYIEERMYEDCFAIYGKIGNHKIDVVSISSHENGISMDPFLKISNSGAQMLFDQLWKNGFRPKDGTGNSGHIDAIKYHLEDMRKIVFEKKVLK